MPCYTTNTNTVEFAKNTDINLFKLAAATMGEQLYSQTATSVDYFSFRFTDGKLTYDPVIFTQDKLAQLKRAYSEEIVNQTAKQNGWQVSWTTNKNGNRQAEVIRRTL